MCKKLLFIGLCSAIAFGFDFRVSEVVTAPGNNRNFDIVSSNNYANPNFICWENQKEENYTVYLKNMGEDNSENIILYQDTVPCVTPQIAINRFALGIKVLWQMKSKGFWKIVYRNFHNDSLGPVVTFVDSLQDSAEISLSIHHLAYTHENQLFIKSFYEQSQNYPEAVFIDSNVTDINIIYDDGFDPTRIVYKKSSPGQENLRIATTAYNHSTDTYYWEFKNIFTEGYETKNPKFCTDGFEILYEIKIDSVWKIRNSEMNYLSQNKTCNFNHPDFYFYYMVTKASDDYTPFFYVFDSDSLAPNQEIFIQPTMVDMVEPVMNISNAPGFDKKPQVAVFGDSLAIIWEHTENNKTNLWWARDINNPDPGAVEDDNRNTFSDQFRLVNNFPNPFNPSTTINFEVLDFGAKTAIVKIYNIQGQLQKTISKNIDNNGHYSVFWDGKTDTGVGVPSGEYIYTIEYNNIIKTGKMCLVK